jgi:hypothetical protein
LGVGSTVGTTVPVGVAAGGFTGVAGALPPPDTVPMLAVPLVVVTATTVDVACPPTLTLPDPTLTLVVSGNGMSVPLFEDPPKLLPASPLPPPLPSLDGGAGGAVSVEGLITAAAGGSTELSGRLTALLVPVLSSVPASGAAGGRGAGVDSFSVEGLVATAAGGATDISGRLTAVPAPLLLSSEGVVGEGAGGDSFSVEGLVVAAAGRTTWLVELLGRSTALLTLLLLPLLVLEREGGGAGGDSFLAEESVTTAAAGVTWVVEISGSPTAVLVPLLSSEEGAGEAAGDDSVWVEESVTTAAGRVTWVVEISGSPTVVLAPLFSSEEGAGEAAGDDSVWVEESVTTAARGVNLVVEISGSPTAVPAPLLSSEEGAGEGAGGDSVWVEESVTTAVVGATLMVDESGSSTASSTPWEEVVGEGIGGDSLVEALVTTGVVDTASMVEEVPLGRLISVPAPLLSPLPASEAVAREGAVGDSVLDVLVTTLVAEVVSVVDERPFPGGDVVSITVFADTLATGSLVAMSMLVTSWDSQVGAAVSALPIVTEWTWVIPSRQTQWRNLAMVLESSESSYGCAQD